MIYPFRIRGSGFLSSVFWHFFRTGKSCALPRSALSSDNRHMRRMNRQTGYIIADSGIFQGLPIMTIRTGWWANQRKAHLIVILTKRGKNLKQCLSFAGISVKGWRRFADIHPQFNILRKEALFKARYPTYNATAAFPLERNRLFQSTSNSDSSTHFSLEDTRLIQVPPAHKLESDRPDAWQYGTARQHRSTLSYRLHPQSSRMSPR